MSAYIEISKLLAVSHPKSPTLKTGLKPQEANSALKAIKTKIDRFNTVATEIANAEKTPPKASVVALIAEAELELLTDFLTPEFRQKYAGQIATYETRSALEEFLKSVYCSELSDLQKLSALRNELEKLTRFSEQGETFLCFLARQTTLQKQIAKLSHEKTAEIFARDNFFRNLTPTNKTFLTSHGKLEDEISVIAEFLDSRQMHLPEANVNSLDGSEISELRAQNRRLMEANKDITAKFDRLAAMYESQATDSRAQITNIAASRGVIRRQRQPYPQRPRQSQDRPARCQSCGIRGHSKDQCRGPQHIRCYKCGRQGHLSYVCNSKN